MNLKYLTDKSLLQDTKDLAQQYRSVTTKLLHHLREIENRKLYSELGYNSIFTYLVEELGFSESSAQRRLTGMRMIKEMPELEKKIETGEHTLSNLNLAAQKFKQEDITDIEFKKDILASLENTSTRTCEKTLSEIVNPSALPIQPIRNFHIINVSVSDSTYEKYELVRSLYYHQKLSKDEMFRRIFDIVIHRLESDKFKINSTRKTETKNPRFIAAAVKKAVYLRDKVCQKCGSKNALEFDHIKPYALGGKTEIKNLRILCRNCNQRQRVTSNLHFP